MLRACVIEYDGCWNTHLPLLEFSYNNTHHYIIDMDSYEILYGRKFRTPTYWLEPGETHFVSSEITQITMDRVNKARDCL